MVTAIACGDRHHETLHSPRTSSSLPLWRYNSDSLGLLSNILPHVRTYVALIHRAHLALHLPVNENLIKP